MEHLWSSHLRLKMEIDRLYTTSNEYVQQDRKPWAGLLQLNSQRKALEMPPDYHYNALYQRAHRIRFSMDTRKPLSFYQSPSPP